MAAHYFRLNIDLTAFSAELLSAQEVIPRARIIAQAAGVTMERAADLLTQSGNSVRTAIVMGTAGVSREEAERRLTACGGRVRQALGQ